LKGTAFPYIMFVYVLDNHLERY